MMLAAVDNAILYLIAMSAYGVWAWWNDRKQKKAIAEEEARRAALPPEQRAKQTAGPPATGGSGEDERMRKFLEALGVPAGQKGAPTRPSPAPAPAPAPRTEPRPKPASPTLAPRPMAMPTQSPLFRPSHEPAAPPVAIPKRPIPRPVVVVAAPAPLTEFEIAAHAQDVVVNPYALAAINEVTFEEASAFDTTGATPTTSVAPRFVSLQGKALREILANRESLRTAIIAREVLGPPVGM